MKKIYSFRFRLRSYALILALCCPTTYLLAQSQQPTITVTGVTSDASGPLAGVTLILKPSNKGTLSNVDGHYSITAHPTDSLQVSYLGYATQIIPIANRAIINIVLHEDTTSLKEVVINAGYYTVKDRERTGSIARITAKDIEKQPIINPLAVMQGRMSGVAITQSSGVPGGGFNVQIRGINSLRANGNAVLFIVDGVPYNSQSMGSSQTSSGLLPSTFSPLNNINPTDIESIEVLKDADATAIYGSRGANGVVLITTKNALRDKTQFSLNTYSSFGQVTKTMKMMNTDQYLSMREEAFANDGFTTYPANAYDINGTWDQNRYTNWHKELIGGTAYINNIQASLSGGNAQTKFILSGTYRNESTVFPGDDNYRKAAIHSVLSHNSINDKFKIKLNVNYANDKNSIQANDLTMQAYRLAPNAPALYDENGNLNWENGTFENPLANGYSQYLNLSNNLTANATFNYKLTNNIELTTSLGYNETQLNESRTLPSTIYNPIYGVTSASSILTLNNGSRNTWIIEPQLNWTKNWNHHELSILLGSTLQSEKNNSLTQRGTGFSSNSLIESMAAASNVSVLNEQVTEYRYQAVFARFNYKLKDTYIINLTGRRDGSSRFGPDKRFANFGAIGLAWLFSNEAFLKQSKALGFGKLRASYGVTGSDQIGDYQYLNTYSVNANTYNGITTLQPTQLFNPNFGWETNKKLEIATELGLFDNKISLTAAWYKNKSSNQLVGIPLPATTGFPSIQANLDAVISNTGFEIDLQTTNVEHDNFTWSTSANITIPKNELLKFEGLEASTYANTYVIGESLQITKSYHYTGINPDTGTYQFEDYNNDGLISSADRQYINDISPRWYGGFKNQIQFKNWELDVFFQFVKQKGRNYLYSVNIPGSFTNMPIEVLNHWPENGETSEIQSYTSGLNPSALTAYFRYRDSNAAISDASFIRLKSISLSYNLPENWFKSLTGTIYLQGQNLLTFTKYKGPDPENQSLSFLPPLRQYTLGLQLNF